MKTTYGEITEAMRGLMKIADIRRAPATSRKLFRLRMAINPAFEFYADEQNKLIEECGGTVAVSGMVSFANKDGKTDYEKRNKELMDMEEEITWEKPKIYDSELKEISPEEMWMLRNFIEFVE
jgi:hypothetical protein